MRYEGLRHLIDITANEVGLAVGIRIKLLMLLYRLSSYAMSRGGLAWVLLFPAYAAYRFYGEFLLGIELPASVIAGPGLRIYHGYGLVVHCDTQIGSRCLLRQGVTLGNKVGRDGTISRAPVIGDDVEFGAGSMAIGPIHVGSNATIGAGTIVTIDVPAGSVVVGAGCRILPPLDS